jgi:hypothetical protein
LVGLGTSRASRGGTNVRIAAKSVRWTTAGHAIANLGGVAGARCGATRFILLERRSEHTSCPGCTETHGAFGVGTGVVVRGAGLAVARSVTLVAFGAHERITATCPGCSGAILTSGNRNAGVGCAFAIVVAVASSATLTGTSLALLAEGTLIAVIAAIAIQ